jgi:hypothetical protein
MSDELRLGTLGDEILAAPSAPLGDGVLETGATIPIPAPLQGGISIPTPAPLQGDGMTVPIPLHASNDDLPLPPPPFLSAADDMPQPPIPFGADLPILWGGISIPTP